MEEQHGVNHLTHKPDFQGKDPRIHINVVNLNEEQIGIEWDVRACGNFLEDNGRWMRLRPGEEVPA